MILPLIFGIVSITWGIINFRTYILFKMGIKMKASVTNAVYEELGVKRKRPSVKITYKYLIDNREYTNTEISSEGKHLFKIHSMKGESIHIAVQKNASKKATLKPLNHYFRSFCFFLLIGTILVIVAIASTKN